MPEREIFFMGNCSNVYHFLKVRLNFQLGASDVLQMAVAERLDNKDLREQTAVWDLSVGGK